MTTDYIVDGKENKEFVKASDSQIHDDGLITLEGENFERFGKLKFIDRISKTARRRGTGCFTSC